MKPSPTTVQENEGNPRGESYKHVNVKAAWPEQYFLDLHTHHSSFLLEWSFWGPPDQSAIYHFCSLPALMENCVENEWSSWEAVGVSGMHWPPAPESCLRLPVVLPFSYLYFIRQVDMTSDHQVKCEVKTFQELLCGSNPSSPCQRNFVISFQREVANIAMA